MYRKIAYAQHQYLHFHLTGIIYQARFEPSVTCQYEAATPGSSDKEHEVFGRVKLEILGHKEREQLEDALMVLDNYRGLDEDVFQSPQCKLIDIGTEP